ncbi:hypothetical protein ACIRP7_14010 [Streptomyces sp. NPDC102270]|uniref:hypothetical protein n=1 Tax=Streptomyces sp. NPDC102270 TaxID=3366150 RepID=UPI0038233CE3
MHAKVSSLGLRFFAHAPGAPTCTLAEESKAHHLLKLEFSYCSVFVRITRLGSL